MYSDAVREAAALLEEQLVLVGRTMEAMKLEIRLKSNEVQAMTAELAELERETKRIQGALGILATVPRATEAGGPSADPDDHPSAPRVSVRSYVQELTEGAYQKWTSAELVTRIEEDIASNRVNIQVDNLRSSVRSAVWALTNDQVLRRLSDDRVIATKWEPNTIPTPWIQEFPSDSPSELAPMLSGENAPR